MIAGRSNYDVFYFLQTPEDHAAVTAKINKFIADREAKELAEKGGASDGNASPAPESEATIGADAQNEQVGGVEN